MLQQRAQVTCVMQLLSNNPYRDLPAGVLLHGQVSACQSLNLLTAFLIIFCLNALYIDVYLLLGAQNECCMENIRRIQQHRIHVSDLFEIQYRHMPHAFIFLYHFILFLSVICFIVCDLIGAKCRACKDGLSPVKAATMSSKQLIIKIVGYYKRFIVLEWKYFLLYCCTKVKNTEYESNSGRIWNQDLTGNLFPRGWLLDVFIRHNQTTLISIHNPAQFL